MRASKCDRCKILEKQPFRELIVASLATLASKVPKALVTKAPFAQAFGSAAEGAVRRGLFEESSHGRGGAVSNRLAGKTMPNPVARAACGVVITGLMLVSPALASEWQLISNDGTVSIERRDYEGSALQEIRGVTRLKATLNAVMALLKDAEFNSRWVYRSGGATVLQENGYEQAYVYGVVDAPWPIQDRDTVVRFDYSQHPVSAEILITISNFPSFTAPKTPYVRVPDFGGFWRLSPIADGWVEVTYQVYGDPGGWIPVWLANAAATKSVTKTLENMSWAVGRYADARSAFVREAPGRE